MNILVSTVPFGQRDSTPLELMEGADISYRLNPLGRKLTERELSELIEDVDVLIAGTEQITENVIEHANKLRLIARVGIGLDSVDLVAARNRGVEVTYTPDAPTTAVAELTVGLMIDLLRSVHLSNNELHQGHWQRYVGSRLSNSVVGIIGAGRIGSTVIKYLSSFDCNRVLVNDLVDSKEICSNAPCEWHDKETIYRNSDVISIHVPLTKLTRNLITERELMMMKSDAVLINTARGGIVNEQSLFEVMFHGHLSGAAIDTFESEPYVGPLASIDRCLLTAHIGSMSEDCRIRMEVEATQEAVRFITGKPLIQKVPLEEYENQEHLGWERSNG